jgi:hypothetical protein
MSDSDTGQDFTIPFNATYRTLRHHPRASARQGLHHTTIIAVIVAASVGTLLVIILCWRIFSRLSSRVKRAPLPPRQPLVHHREHQLAAFSDYKNAVIIPVPDVMSTAPIRYGSNASLIPGTEASIDDNPFSSHGSPLPPPTPPFFTPHLPPSASSTSLPLSNHSSPSSRAASPNPSSKRPSARFDPRRCSVASVGTSLTSKTARSRSSVRCAPHAPHSNIQIVLPAPLASELYSRVASEDLHGQRTVLSDNTYRDSWGSSLADKWIPVGQHAMPGPMQPRSRHDSMEGPSRLRRRM